MLEAEPDNALIPSYAWDRAGVDMREEDFMPELEDKQKRRVRRPRLVTEVPLAHPQPRESEENRESSEEEERKFSTSLRDEAPITRDQDIVTPTTSGSITTIAGRSVVTSVTSSAAAGLSSLNKTPKMTIRPELLDYMRKNSDQVEFQYTELTRKKRTSNTLPRDDRRALTPPSQNQHQQAIKNVEQWHTPRENFSELRREDSETEHVGGETSSGLTEHEKIRYERLRVTLGSNRKQMSDRRKSLNLNRTNLRPVTKRELEAELSSDNQNAVYTWERPEKLRYQRANEIERERERRRNEAERASHRSDSSVSVLSRNSRERDSAYRDSPRRQRRGRDSYRSDSSVRTLSRHSREQRYDYRGSTRCHVRERERYYTESESDSEDECLERRRRSPARMQDLFDARSIAESGRGERPAQRNTARAAKHLKTLGMKLTGEDRNEDPEEFLEQLQDAREGIDVNDIEFLGAVPCVFSRAASRWYRTTKSSLFSWNDFKKAFKH